MSLYKATSTCSAQFSVVSWTVNDYVTSRLVIVFRYTSVFRGFMQLIIRDIFEFKVFIVHSCRVGVCRDKLGGRASSL